jgi:CBS domain-containing protein
LETVAANAGASRTIAVADAVDKTVVEVMLARPKTLSGDAQVREVRVAFERPAVRTVLLADGDRFVGAVEREAVPADAPDDAPARDYVDPDPLTVTPAMPMTEAMTLLEGRSEPRLIVVDEDGVTLRGLLCANGSVTGFCIRPD